MQSGSSSGRSWSAARPSRESTLRVSTGERPPCISVDRLRVGWLDGVPREQKMLKGHLPRVIYHQVYQHTKINFVPPNFKPASVQSAPCVCERKFFVDNLLVRVRHID